jgi:hypothetical protein
MFTSVFIHRTSTRWKSVRTNDLELLRRAIRNTSHSILKPRANVNKIDGGAPVTREGKLATRALQLHNLVGRRY